MSYKHDENGRLCGSVGKYKTADELFVAVKDYCDNPPLREYKYKHDTYEVPCMTFDALADALGYRGGRQSIYDQAKRGPEFSEVVEYARSLYYGS